LDNTHYSYVGEVAELVGGTWLKDETDGNGEQEYVNNVRNLKMNALL
jgi:hypothetical protein